MLVRLIDRRAVKAEAKELLRTATVSPLRFTLLFLLIDLAFDEISSAVGFLWLSDWNVSIGPPSFPLSLSFITILVGLLSAVLYAGYANYCLCVRRGVAMPYESLFDAFPFAGKVILLSIIVDTLTVLGLMFFVVPGVWVLLTYAFSLYHLCEDPGAGVLAAMRRSREETQGYKMQLFMLLLSFLPLLLLAGLAVGLCEELLLGGAFPETLSGELLHTLVYGLISGCAAIYIQPYMALARVCFYRQATDTPAEPKEPWEL